MLNLNYAGLQDRAAWEDAGVSLPNYDWKAMAAETEVNPTWVHFGAGNIFRAFIAKLQHDLLNQGLVKGGIVAADTFDFDNINMIYHPHDAMTMLVLLMPLEMEATTSFFMDPSGISRTSMVMASWG